MPVSPTASYPDVVPVLTDGVVTLRAHRHSDVPAIVEQCNDPESVRFTTVPQPYGVQQAESFIGTLVPGGWAEEFGTKMWAIEATDPGDPDGIARFAGSVDYRPTPEGVAEIGFGLHPWARGAHIMSRAVRLVVGHAFEQGIQTLHWRAHAGNWGSWRVAWSCGFRYEATVRDLVTQRGERRDGWIGTLRRGEPLEPPTRWLETPVLEGEQVRLRPWREADAPAPDRVLDKASRRFMPGFVPTAETFEEWLTTQRGRAAVGNAVTWCIADLDTDEALGNISCFRLDFALIAGSGMVSYWLHPEGRGRGAASEAMDLLVAHAFAPSDHGGLGLHRLGSNTDIDNLASQRVLRRAGFVEHGVEHAAMAHEDGPATDSPHFELLASAERDAQRVVPRRPATLTTERFRLREWRAGDRPRVDQPVDADSARFMPAGAKPDHDTFDTWLGRKRREMDAGTAVHWCIADAASDDPLGCLQVFQIGEGSPGNAEVGYWLHSDARGRGVLGEVLAAGVEHAFTPQDEGGLGLRRLHAGTDLANTSSQRVLQRAGFRLWGTDHQSYARSDGSISDGAFFELLAGDAERSTGLEAVTIEGPVATPGDRAGIRLRAWRDDDAARIEQAFADPALRHWFESLPGPGDAQAGRGYVELTRERLHAGTALFWCVADATTDTCLGSIGLMDLAGEDRTCAEVGYWLHPDARGRGAMRQAVGLAVRHAFVPVEDGGLGLRRLRLNVADGNDASSKVALAQGFTEVGRDRAADRLGDGSFVDLRRFDLLATEWRDGPLGAAPVR